MEGKEDATRPPSLSTSLSSLPPRIVSPTKADPKLLSRLSTMDMMTISQNKHLSVRDRIREMHALKLAPYPKSCHRESTILMPKKSKFSCCHSQGKLTCTLHLDLHGLYWQRRNIPTDHLIAAIQSAPTQFVVHYVVKYPSMAFHSVQFESENVEDATAWVEAIQILVKWHARVPLDATRRIQVIIDDTIADAGAAWDMMKLVFQLASIDCVVVNSLDVVSFGKTMALDNAFEACIVVGSALSFHRVVNGIFQREESSWRRLVSSMPLGVLETPMDPHDSSLLVYNAIKRKMRPQDLVACHLNQEYVVLSTSSVNLGSTVFSISSQSPIPGLQSQRLSPTASTELDPEAANVNFQHHVELCSIYNPSEPNLKYWKGSLQNDRAALQASTSTTTSPLLGLSIALTQNQTMQIRTYTPGTMWHRWNEHQETTKGDHVRSLALTLPHAWNISIDGSSPRLVSGHIQFDCISNILHTF